MSPHDSADRTGCAARSARGLALAVLLAARAGDLVSNFEAAGTLAASVMTTYALLRSWRFVISIVRGSL